MICPNCGKATNEAETCEHCGGNLDFKEKGKTISFTLPNNIFALIAFAVSLIAMIIFLFWVHELDYSVIEDLETYREIEDWRDNAQNLSVWLKIMCPVGLVFSVIGLEDAFRSKTGIAISVLAICICCAVFVIVFSVDFSIIGMMLGLDD